MIQDSDPEYNSDCPYEKYNVILDSTKDFGALLLGNVQASEDAECFKSENITIVLDVAGCNYKYPEGMVQHCKVIMAEDNYDFDLSAHFEDCFDFIHKHRSQHHNVLVHCMAGVSRSSTVVIGYLMKYYKMDMNSAYSFVKKKRSCICPNDAFLKQLLKYEASLRQGMLALPPSENYTNK